MIAAGIAERVGPRHWTAAVLLLALLALPFHVHAFSPKPQLAPECSCYQGARSSAVALPTTAAWVPWFQATVLHHEQPGLSSRIAFDFHSIRAPPPLLSL